MLSVIAPQSWYLDILSAGHDVKGEFSDDTYVLISYILLHPTLNCSSRLERLARETVSAHFLSLSVMKKNHFISLTPCFR